MNIQYHSDVAITGIEVSLFVAHLGGAIWNPMIVWSEKFCVFIRIFCSDGTVGLGECWCLDSKPDTILAYLRTEVCPQLKGRELQDVPAIFERLRHRATLTSRHGLLESALSGFDIALWDMAAKRAGVPLWKFLNDNGSGAAALYCSGGIYGNNKTISDLVAEMEGLANKGFSCLKMKIGGASEEEDIARVNAVLEAIGPKTKLIIDSVYSYDRETALRIFRSFAPDRIEAFQSPLPQNDLKGMQWLVAQGVPVMAVEAEYRRELHSALIEMNAVRFLQIAPIACGGISRMMALVEELATTDVDLSLEISSSSVAVLAAAHFAAACPRVAHVEYHSIHQVFSDRMNMGPANFTNSRFSPSNEPGLGITLGADDLAVQYTC